MNEKVILTSEQAKAMLPDGDTVHVMGNPTTNVLVGADWSREDIAKQIDTAVGCELAGAKATASGYGLAVWPSEDRVLFVQTKQQEQSK
jgi:hypothetical protein